ncbi:hypothetical protein NVIE_1556 [Nitrososphaera viennensis EN76]|uniref:Uncharacterized protein n=1 Tax=Nitrososphaera viennensis EN76 TaxID=926571 RepID=A0A060HKH9_9ARCH|nr:hypothetical protein NVIE_1556 [Nitrososphaera viennensis EN76]
MARLKDIPEARSTLLAASEIGYITTKSLAKANNNNLL